jgi:2-phosphoglycerate kinase
MSSQAWSVLVLFGASGTGKSTAAAEIARRCGMTWMQVDDLRLAFQYSRVALPERTDQLYAFMDDPDIWRRPIAVTRQAFINVAELMVPAVRVVIDSHVVTEVPMVLEGDGILPALAEDPVIRPHVASGAVRFCCVRASGEHELLENMVARGRGMDVDDRAQHRAQAAANEAFGAWLAEESARLGIPVVASQPFGTLVERVLDAAAFSPCQPPSS